MNEAIVEECIRRMLEEGLCLDINDAHIKDTPKRVAKMYCRELFSSFEEEDLKLTVFKNETHYDEIIMLDNIPFVSVCAHHLLPFQGKAWFAYIPNKSIIGASKIARIVDFYSRRPQIQEHLTKSIIEHFINIVQPTGAMLVMRAVHGCMSCRGIRQDNGGGMITSAVSGAFKINEKTRNEALMLIKLSQGEI